jgi:transmembrane sensor
MCLEGMTDIPDAQITRLADWLSGACSLDEEREVELWIAERPERRDVVERLIHARTLVRAEMAATPRVEGVGEAVRRRIRVPVGTPSAPMVAPQTPAGAVHRKRTIVATPWWRRPATVVASAIGVTAVAVASYLFIPGARRLPGTAEPSQIYTTTNGERATLQLSDGTRVVLNVASRLEVPQSFDSRNRTVRLVGEAAFTVTHASGAPFTILARETRTTVLGTEFGVRAYQADSTVQIAVRTGKVSVDGVVLAARDVGRFGAQSVEIRRGQSVDAALGFMAGKLILTGGPLAEVVPALERWYDVDLRFGTPSLAAQRLEATLGPGSRTDLIQTLEFALRARVVADGRVLTIYAR